MVKNRILIVDDDARLWEAITDTLILSGYECQEASGGAQALDLQSRFRISMVISDIQMEGMDGHRLH